MMDNEISRSKCELPLLPVEYRGVNNIQFAGTYSKELPNYYNSNLTSNVEQGQIPLLLATPPQSPSQQETTVPPMMDMPSLRATLGSNFTGYAPTGYIVHIPCILCKQPFSDIDSLKEHLTKHASQLNMGRGGPAKHPVAPPTAPPVAIPRSVLNKPNLESASKCICKCCGLGFSSEMYLYLHIRMHHKLPVQKKKQWCSKAFKCHVCKKSFRREANLLKHMHFRHSRQHTVVPAAAAFQAEQTQSTVQSTLTVQSMQTAQPTLTAQPKLTVQPTLTAQPKLTVQPTLTAQSKLTVQQLPTAQPTITAQPAFTVQPTSPAQPPTHPTPPSSADGGVCKPNKKVVWSTKLLNAVAAANYSPATESASKYKSPTEEFSYFTRKPKQKYALRSPFCNPNLWVDYGDHVP